MGFVGGTLRCWHLRQKRHKRAFFYLGNCSWYNGTEQRRQVCIGTGTKMEATLLCSPQRDTHLTFLYRHTKQRDWNRWQHGKCEEYTSTPPLLYCHDLPLSLAHWRLCSRMDENVLPESNRLFIRIITMIMKRLWLLFIWLVLPPAFFFMSKKYGFKTWERWILTIHSPSNLILIFVLYCIYIIWGLNNFANQILPNTN